jgi:hypothetical protein
LTADRGHRAHVRIGGIVWGGLVAAFCVLMAVSRCMTMSHWVGDCAFSFLAGLILMHILYFWVLKVPLQVQHFRVCGTHAVSPKLWELRLCALAFPVAIGFLCIGFGVRSFWEQPVPWLACLLVPGIALAAYFSHKAIRLHGSVIACYSSGCERTPISNTKDPG